MEQPIGPGRVRTTAAVLLVVVALLGAPAAHALQVVNGTFDPASLATTGLLYSLLGALVLVRRPENGLGPVLAVIGLLSVLGAVSEAITATTYGTGLYAVPGARWAAWVGDWYWLPVMWLQFVGLPLLFPDGRLPSGVGWRRFGGAVAVVAGVSLVLAVGGRDIVLDGLQLGRSGDASTSLALPNPVAFLPVGNFERDVAGLVVLLPVSAIVAASSLVGRYRRATGVVRQQLLVAVTGIVVAVLAYAAGAALDVGRSPVLRLVLVPVILIIPVTLGVAILRYRLYDIDRVLSRTVAWLLVSAALLAVYLGGVVVLQSLLQPLVGDGDLPVALATLAAAALARPLLRAVQHAVDRRFNRAHYDAAHTVDEFTRGLRDEVSRDAILTDITAVTRTTFQPQTVAVHLLTERGAP